ncbi:hypothetical protein R3X46_25070, partial [Salmonella enterica subsp. enterica serovar Agona]|uniref:hypothetical protein n=1 Tax=Salmonella enterica TaxID=28901 RepID=UPI002A7600FC
LWPASRRCLSGLIVSSIAGARVPGVGALCWKYRIQKPLFYPALWPASRRCLSGLIVSSIAGARVPGVGALCWKYR